MLLLLSSLLLLLLQRKLKEQASLQLNKNVWIVARANTISYTMPWNVNVVQTHSNRSKHKTFIILTSNETVVTLKYSSTAINLRSWLLAVFFSLDNPWGFWDETFWLKGNGTRYGRGTRTRPYHSVSPSSLHCQRHLRSRWLNARPSDP